MTLKIYGIARTRAARTLWMAHELGIPYEFVKTAPADGDTQRAAFLAINPNGQVPTIDDDGLVVWESLAINLHLAKRHGGPLAPRDLGEDARMTMWTVWAGTSFEQDAHEVVVHTVNLPPEKRDAAKVAASIERLQGPLRALETSLAKGGGHLVGRRFTVADLNVACVAFYLRAAPQALAGFPGVAAWYRAATDRAAFKTMIALREKG